VTLTIERILTPSYGNKNLVLNPFFPCNDFIKMDDGRPFPLICFGRATPGQAEVWV
jgi:hypothetical protein